MGTAEHSYKWILYGDDDTVFFQDNVIAMLGTLDHRQPYLLSDCLWWPEGGNGKSSGVSKNAYARASFCTSVQRHKAQQNSGLFTCQLWLRSPSTLIHSTLCIESPMYLTQFGPNSEGFDTVSETKNNMG